MIVLVEVEEVVAVPLRCARCLGTQPQKDEYFIQ